MRENIQRELFYSESSEDRGKVLAVLAASRLSARCLYAISQNQWQRIRR